MKQKPLYDQAYVDEGDGHVVILLHGLFGRIDMWTPAIDALKSNYRVIIPRLPIFEGTKNISDIRQVARTLHEFIEWHELRDVSLVGHDAGGHVAMVYAHDHPGNVMRIVLSGVSGPAYQSEEIVHEVYAHRRPCPPAGGAGTHVETLLNKLDHHVMLLWGLEDKITPPEVTLHFHDYLQNSEVRFLERSGHLPMVEEPEAFARHLISFLN